MAKSGRADAVVAADSAAEIIARLGGRLGDITRSLQQHVLTEVSEFRDDTQLAQLLKDSVEQNVDTVFTAIRHGIPIENVEPPTAALEHARRLAQRGVSANALIRSYRLGQQKLLNIVLDEVRATDLDPRRSLDVFQQITTTTFSYIDWISQQVIAAYQAEHDRWLETQNTTRTVRIRELLDAEVVDADAVSTEIGYPLRRVHLAVVASYPQTHHGDELVRMERFVRELAECLESKGHPLFIAADRLTGWGWIPLAAETAPGAVECVRRLATTYQQPPSLAVGDPLPGVDGFRRSHRQALGAHAVAIAAGPDAQQIVTNDDPGLSAAALLGENEGIACRHFLRRALDQLIDIAVQHIELECLIEEFARRIVVFHSELGARDAVILGGKIEHRQRQIVRAGLLDVENGEGQLFLRCIRTGYGAGFGFRALRRSSRSRRYRRLRRRRVFSARGPHS